MSTVTTRDAVVIGRRLVQVLVAVRMRRRWRHRRRRSTEPDGRQLGGAHQVASVNGGKQRWRRVVVDCGEVWGASRGRRRCVVLT